jgi:hypothetical protein
MPQTNKMFWLVLGEKVLSSLCLLCSTETEARAGLQKVRLHKPKLLALGTRSRPVTPTDTIDFPEPKMWVHLVLQKKQGYRKNHLRRIKDFEVLGPMQHTLFSHFNVFPF